MRCQSCNLFTTLNLEEPEVEEEPEIDDTGHISMEVSLLLTTECCGEEAKSATLTLGADVDWKTAFKDHLVWPVSGEPSFDEGCGFEVDAAEPTPVEETIRRKQFYGARIHYTVNCKCRVPGLKPLVEGDMGAQIAASEMDEV